jgi:hypothetical protein
MNKALRPNTASTLIIEEPNLMFESLSILEKGTAKKNLTPTDIKNKI